MTITEVKLNQKKDQKNPEKTKKIEEDIQANINFQKKNCLYQLLAYNATFGSAKKIVLTELCFNQVRINLTSYVHLTQVS